MKKHRTLKEIFCTEELKFFVSEGVLINDESSKQAVLDDWEKRYKKYIELWLSQEGLF